MKKTSILMLIAVSILSMNTLFAQVTGGNENKTAEIELPTTVMKGLHTLFYKAFNDPELIEFIEKELKEDEDTEYTLSSEVLEVINKKEETKTSITITENKFNISIDSAGHKTQMRFTLQDTESSIFYFTGEEDIIAKKAEEKDISYEEAKEEIELGFLLAFGLLGSLDYESLKQEFKPEIMKNLQTPTKKI